METVSKRERIMEHLRERFLAVRMNDGEGYTTQWNIVTRTPLGKSEISMGDAVGLFDPNETKTQEMMFMRCSLTVQVEFYYSMQLGDNAATELNRLLLDVQRTMRQDIQCGGLCLNIVESRSELDIDGPGDSLVVGLAEFQVLYRHSVNDPRN
jgi:hypothetical protein